MFHVSILTPKRVVFEGSVSRVQLPGDRGEFEILPYHAPLVSLLRRGAVVIDGEKSIPIRRGMVKFDLSECVIVVEE